MGTKENIFLIGFMGSGKSTMGRMLAKALNWNFIDTDEWIEKKAGLSIARIFSERGEDHFRALENDALHHLAQQKNTIIATGGGMPCFFDHIKIMNQYGLTVYLELDAKALVERLRNETEQRPLLHEKSEAELIRWIQSKLDERTPYYTQATFRMDGNKQRDELLNDLLEQLETHV